MLSYRLPVIWTTISAIALVALIALVFLGATLTANLSGAATYLIMLGASAVLATALAIPTVVVNKSRLGDKRPA